MICPDFELLAIGLTCAKKSASLASVSLDLLLASRTNVKFENSITQSTDDVIGLHRGSRDLHELEEGLGHALGTRGTGVALVNRVAQQFRQIE